MTAAEQASLEALRATVESGFKEIRELMEKRRDQELADHGEFRTEINTIKAEIKSELAVKTAADVLWGRIWKLAAFVVSTAIAVATVFFTVAH